jgi:hypothetical protein
MARPRATEPRDVRVSIRMTEREADLLCRLAKEGSRSAALRKTFTAYISKMGGPQALQDTDGAYTQRERRKAKRGGSSEAEKAAQVDTLDKMWDRPAVRVINLPVERVPYPPEPRVITPRDIKGPGDETGG